MTNPSPLFMNKPDIQVQVQLHAAPQYTTVSEQAFQYIITIINRSDETWQLLRRHWDMSDASGQTFTVDGEGVVGEQPILAPGASYTYHSFVTVRATPGVMHGYYMMRNAWGQEAQVPVPPFRLGHKAQLLN